MPKMVNNLKIRQKEQEKQKKDLYKMEMIMIQMVNHLSIRKKILGKIEEIPAQGGAQIDAK